MQLALNPLCDVFLSNDQRMSSLKFLKRVSSCMPHDDDNGLRKRMEKRRN